MVPTKHNPKSDRLAKPAAKLPTNNPYPDRD